MCTQSGCVTQRCHNSPVGKWRLASANDVMHRKRVEDFGRFWKSQWVEVRPASGEDGWFSFACGDLCGGCHTCWEEGRWKSQNRKVVPLSPYVKEPLNSKVIKGFVPEQRSRQVFFVFRDSYVLCYIYIYEHYMSISHMAISGYGTLEHKYLFGEIQVSVHSSWNSFPGLYM